MIAVAAGVVVIVSGIFGEDMTADQVFEKVKATYESMQTCKAEGIITLEIWPSATPNCCPEKASRSRTNGSARRWTTATVLTAPMKRSASGPRPDTKTDSRDSRHPSQTSPHSKQSFSRQDAKLAKEIAAVWL